MSTGTTHGRQTRVALARPDGSPIRALVVDDEPMLGDLLSMVLRYEGWVVETSCTGQEGIRAARAGEPDVIVLDVMLPDVSGLEVLRRIHAFRPDVPVLFLTARDASRTA